MRSESSENVQEVPPDEEDGDIDSDNKNEVKHKAKKCRYIKRKDAVTDTIYPIATEVPEGLPTTSPISNRGTIDAPLANLRKPKNMCIEVRTTSTSRVSNPPPTRECQAAPQKGISLHNKPIFGNTPSISKEDEGTILGEDSDNEVSHNDGTHEPPKPTKGRESQSHEVASNHKDPERMEAPKENTEHVLRLKSVLEKILPNKKHLGQAKFIVDIKEKKKEGLAGLRINIRRGQNLQQ